MSEKQKADKKPSPVRSVEELILSVFISLLVLVLGVALGRLTIWTVVLASVIVLCGVVVGALLAKRFSPAFSFGAHETELLQSIKAELTHITRSLPTHLLTEEQYSRVESSAETKAVIICMHEMGLEFDPDPARREILTVSYDVVVRNNIERGVSYHWIAPDTGLNQVRSGAIFELFPAQAVRVALLSIDDWTRLPFVFETVFIVSEAAGRRHIEGFLQIPILSVGLERYWIRIDADRRDEWFGSARPHLDEGLLRLRQPGT